MLFPTFEFLAFFVGLLLLLAIFGASQQRKVLLLAASYVFYMAWNPAFITLIVFSTVVDFTVGRLMERTEHGGRRKALLTVSLTANLGLLAIFKYSGFLVANLLAFLRPLGIDPSWPELNLILPVGISFYTFQTLSYTIDVYRGRLSPTRSPLDFALFVSFFPQLVAGPIVRASEFLPQLEVGHRLRLDRLGFFIILRGLVKKVIIADNIGGFADTILIDPGAWGSLVIWLAAVAFAVQIYCDFSGYSDMAIGLARILGFRLPQNFSRPYFAQNPPDFWRRWHITLSSWLRDYLYIPLGGNRGSSLATYRNLMLTMLLGGLWHGASWNFVLWGGLHGGALVVHRSFRAQRGFGVVNGGLATRRILSWVGFQYFVLVTWLAFRITDPADIFTAIGKFVLFDFRFNLADLGLGDEGLFSTVLLIAVFLLLHLYSHWRGSLDIRLATAPLWLSLSASFLAGLALVLLWPSEEAPFIYFQF